MITLYDLPTLSGDPSSSPFAVRIRFALRIKNLPFTTRFVEYNEIAAAAKEIGAPPTGVRQDGSPKYTVPMIYDSETKTAVADSLLIAKYLDRTYPDSGPTLVPDDTEILQNFFASDTSFTFLTPLYPLLRVGVFRKISPSMQKQYVNIGPPFDPHEKFDEKEMAEKWAQVEATLRKMDGVMGSRDTLGKAKEPTFADTALGANLLLIRYVVGADSPEWKALMLWHNGRWGKYLDWLENYGINPVKMS
ncbi:hypothetical protein GYMLUDRAFT_247854 [Collybiopsis luxurians FD-317 M1]|uniref:Unplaced genomic scaffold GYMLUscaffold_50, whole genome shotgun sequence n=1 Tax=Collybiopsis luxurians FD-317 M1 TaxID=944289 RepID=A0A0D0CMB1_9AGAR|nr:hypothetical protein GYMLUDRAFT_247854 [Collybiopsis luxurians FD-317 M1]